MEVVFVLFPVFVRGIVLGLRLTGTRDSWAIWKLGALGVGRLATRKPKSELSFRKGFGAVVSYAREPYSAYDNQKEEEALTFDSLFVLQS
jgi:hypothetical protein